MDEYLGLSLVADDTTVLRTSIELEEGGAENKVMARFKEGTIKTRMRLFSWQRGEQRRKDARSVDGAGTG